MTCRWCADRDACTVLYDWPTCSTCARSKPSVRVKAWLQQVRRSHERMAKHDPTRRPD